MKKCILYGHGGSYNHGAEAITTTTIKLIKKINSDVDIFLSTHFAEQDKKYLINVDKYLEKNIEYWNAAKKSESPQYYDNLIYEDTLNAIDDKSICFSVGGDNYCYNNWHRWANINEYAKSKGAKSILWGCSIEPSMIDADMINALNNHDIIIARESLTYDSLIKNGVKTRLLLVPDVAFLLEPEEVKLPDNFIENNTLGINISPLTMRCSGNRNDYIDSFINIINYTIENTDMNISLIPHVVMPNDNDYLLLKEIYESLNHKDRISLIGDNYSAAEYKYIISKCRLFIGARTHSTIAAYSSCVPTLAISYSVKAKGIATDVMEKIKDYVIPANDVNSNSLLQLYKEMIKRQQKDKEHLHAIIPKYKNEAKINYTKLLEEFLL